MSITDQTLRQSLDVNHYIPVGFGYGQLKSAAQVAASIYGCDWALKCPTTTEGFQLKQQLRDLVISSIPSSHSNKDVVWQRFREYAIKFHSTASL